MEFSLKYKRVFRWSIIALAIWLSGALFYEFFLQNWHYEYGVERVKKSIVKNFEQKREAFRALENFACHLQPMREIEFLGDGRIRTSLYSDACKPDSVSPIELSWEEFQFLEDQTVKIRFQDTSFETKNWFWTFEGDKQHPHFQQFTKIASLTEVQLDSLEVLLKNANCEAIEIYENQKFTLRFDGFQMCKFEYLFTDSLPEGCRHFVKLENGVFCGEDRFELFCGRVFYKK